MRTLTLSAVKLGACTALLLACSSEAPTNEPNAGSSGNAGTTATAGSGGGSASGGSAGTGGAPGGAGTAGTATSAGTAGASGSGGSAGSSGSGGSAGSAGGSGTNAELDAACTPDFTLDLQDMGPKAAIFTDAIPDPEAFVQEIGRGVCRILYRLPEEVRDANHITLIIEDDPQGVAWKAGDVGDIDVGISTTHLENVQNDGREVAEEIQGILFHEMTHMYQNDDKPEATFEYIGNMYEGIADAVRIRAGHAPSGAAPNDKGGAWYEKSYTSQAFFWLYIDTKYPDFLYQLNLSMKNDGVPWGVDAIETISGQSADALWTEYQAASCCSGDDTSCCQ